MSVKIIRVLFQKDHWRLSIKSDSRRVYRFLENLDTGFCDYPDWNHDNSAITFNYPEKIPKYVKALCARHIEKRIATHSYLKPNQVFIDEAQTI